MTPTDLTIAQARDLLAKHDETYMPREVVETLKASGVYQEPGS